MIAWLDRIAFANGAKRSELIRFCLKTFLDYYEKNKCSGLPNAWKEILETLDQRHNRYNFKVAESKPEYLVKKKGREK